MKAINSDNRQDRSTPMAHGLVLSCSHDPPLRNKKVIRNHATGVTTPKFRKLEFFENIEAGEGSGHQQSQIFFAGANFIASRRRGSYFKCLVEWLHRREIPRQGQLPNRMPMRRSCVFGVLERSAFFKALDFENCQARSTPICYGLALS